MLEEFYTEIRKPMQVKLDFAIALMANISNLSYIKRRHALRLGYMVSFVNRGVNFGF